MNILVTGGSGFLGSHLCERLLKEKNFVIAYDNFFTGRKENISNIINHENFKLVEGDMLNRELMNDTVSENSIDLIFHFAAMVSVKRIQEHPFEMLDSNIQGVKNVLEAAKNNSVKKVVAASSSEVYGEPVEIPESEETPLNADNVYAVSKLVGEKYCESYSKEFGIPTTSLRIFNTYGPRQNSTPYGFVVAIFIRNVLANTPPMIFGDGSQTRSFSYVDDTIEASVLTSKTKKTDGIALNIGNSERVTILDLANKIIKISGKNLKPKFAPARPNDILHRCPDITKMKKILGYTPKVSLDEGLKKTMASF